MTSIKNKYPVFENKELCSKYCIDKLLSMQGGDNGEMVKSGESFGGSEVECDYKEGIIPNGYLVVSHWAEFLILNQKGNPVHRTFHIKAIYDNSKLAD